MTCDIELGKRSHPRYPDLQCMGFDIHQVHILRRKYRGSGSRRTSPFSVSHNCGDTWRLRLFPTFASPRTAAATWNSEFSAIAFATTSVGDATTLVRMAQARVNFIEAATGIVERYVNLGIIEVPRNRYGNCPEILIWAIVCRRRGTFYSLCLNVPLHDGQESKTLQFCGWCVALAQCLTDRNIIIHDK